ncbi:MAG: PAS domain-containing sensor histidine kinase [Candidatus Thermoplasmatota archaeon]
MEEADIVKELKNLEEKGVLYSQNYVSSNLNNDKKIVETDGDNDKDNHFYDTNDIESLKKENEKLKKKVEELKNRYNSLAEYFEIISDTTIALGQKDLFSDVNDIIFQLTPKGRITYINSAVEKIGNYDSYDLIGQNITDLIPKKDWKKIRKTFFPFLKKTTLDREITGFETVLVKKNGDTVPVEVNGKLIKHNVEVMGRKNEVRVQGSIRDITERKKAEQERIRHEKELEAMNEELNATNKELLSTKKELELLNRDLEKKVEQRTAKIKKLLRHKDEFIGQLGHDLKSPLTPLIGLLPVVEEREKDPELKELLRVANRNVKYMRDLVVKTLQLERLNSPNYKSNFEEIKLYNLVENELKDKKTILQNKQITVENNVKKEIKLVCDRIQFKELFDNLLTNAIKFTEENGLIFVDAKKEKKWVTFSVRDTGKGMTQEQIDRIFDEFYKVDTARHNLDSSGLGLPICKRIVEMHNGRIWAESNGIGTGTTFFVSIPSDLKENNKKKK